MRHYVDNLKYFTLAPGKRHWKRMIIMRAIFLFPIEDFIGRSTEPIFRRLVSYIRSTAAHPDQFISGDRVPGGSCETRQHIVKKCRWLKTEGACLDSRRESVTSLDIRLTETEIGCHRAVYITRFDRRALCSPDKINTSAAARRAGTSWRVATNGSPLGSFPAVLENSFGKLIRVVYFLDKQYIQRRIHMNA